ncbi:MAG: hypothetical protein ACRC92_25060 [Peptostreptococcaceae bacterium]
MDSLEKIALSKIATVIANKSFLKVGSNSVWERILSNTGYENLYEEYSKYLNPYTYNGPFENDNNFFKDYYIGIKEIFNKLYDNGNNVKGLLFLLKSIIKEINIEFIVEDRDSVLEEVSTYGKKYYSIEEYLKTLSENDINMFLEKNQSLDFKEFINSLKILNLDLEIVREKNSIKILLERFAGTLELEKEKSKLSEWLNNLNPDFRRVYEQALENYISGNAIATITSCRNLIIGLFNLAKDDKTKWLMGLKKVSTDKNIDLIINPQEILNKPLSSGWNEVKYPRFKTIYAVYSMASDLGDHSLEGPKIDGEMYLEDIKLYDAHLVLRMTEDILIWVMESGRIEKIKNTD